MSKHDYGYVYGVGEQEHRIFDRQTTVDLGKRGWLNKGDEYAVKGERLKRYTFVYSSTNGSAASVLSGSSL